MASATSSPPALTTLPSTLSPAHPPPASDPASVSAIAAAAWRACLVATEGYLEREWQAQVRQRFQSALKPKYPFTRAQSSVALADDVVGGVEDVGVGESAHRHHAAEAREGGAAIEEVGHDHVPRLEAGGVEGRGHLDLPVDALLAQDRDLGSCTGRDERCSDVLVRFEADLREQPAVGRIADAIELLPGAICIVPEGLYPMAGL